MGEFIHEHRMACNDSAIGMVPADGVGYFTDLDSRELPWKGCSAGISSCGITSDGHLKGCLSLPDTFREGSLREREFWDIWFDEKSFGYNRRFSPEKLGENCENCDFGEQCKGGCSVMSYAATGALHNDPYCFQRLNSPAARQDSLLPRDEPRNG